MWRAVAASFLVIAVAGGVIWGTGILSKPPIPTPTPPTATAPATPPRSILEVNGAPTKAAYLPGEEVEVKFKFKNVSSEPITVTPLPPRIQVMPRMQGMRPRPHKVVRSFSAGSEERRLQPGDTWKYTLLWN